MTLRGGSALALALGGCLALTAAMGIGRFVYTPILPFMEQALDLTKFEAGLIASANFLGYLVGALAASSRRIAGGPRTWFLGALALSGATTLGMGLTASFALFLVLRFIGGLASAFVLIFASTLVLERLGAAGRAGLSAVHFAGVGCGIALSAVLVAGLGSGIGLLGEDTVANWRQQWLASGGVSLVALALVAWLVPAAPDSFSTRTATAPTPEGRAVLGKLRALIAAYGLFGFGYVITATFVSSLVRETPGLQSVEPVVWLVVGLSAAPSVALWTWAGRRFGNHVSLAAACLVEAAGVALTVLVIHPAAVILGSALLGGTFMGITAVGLIHARLLSQNDPGADPRRSLALMTAAFGFGQMVGPTFAGAAYRLGDSFLMPSLAAAAALVLAAWLAAGTAEGR